MKWIIVVLLALAIFGGAAYFGYDNFIKEEIAIREERAAPATPQPTPDFGLNEFRAAQALQREGRLAEARSAFITFLQRFPTGPHTEEAKDALGEINLTILLSRYPAPGKTEYIVKRGDVLARVAARTKSTPELIMRMNNLKGTMLRIGERLMIAHPDFSLLIQRKQKELVLLDHAMFFKRYHILEEKLSARQPPKLTTRVADVMAWKGGKRIGLGSKDYPYSIRWIRLALPGYFLYAKPDDAHPNLDVPLPPQGLGFAASDLIELSGLVNTKTPVTVME
jgi:LysM repeat protein